MNKTTTTTPSSSRCRTQKSVSYELRPFEAPSKVPRPPPCGSTGSCATRTRRTDLHLRVCVDGAFRRSLNSARTKDLTFQAPKRDFLVPDAPKTSTLCTPHELGRDPWLLICAWGGAQTRDLAIPVELSSIARAGFCLFVCLLVIFTLAIYISCNAKQRQTKRDSREQFHAVYHVATSIVLRNAVDSM